MLTKHTFSNLKEAVETASGLESCRGTDHRQDRQDNGCRSLTRIEAEAKDEDDDADTTNQAERHTALTGTIEEGNQNDDQLQPKV